jgi:hypothetical protein
MRNRVYFEQRDSLQLNTIIRIGLLKCSDKKIILNLGFALLNIYKIF